MDKSVFTMDNIVLNASFHTKGEAIKACGQILVDQGYCLPSYINDMLERDKSACVYIGEGIAIPHGIYESDDKIIKSGISFLQIPDGVAFENGIAYMLIGIAGKNDNHMEILSNIALVCSNHKNVEILKGSHDKDEIYKILTTIS